MPLDLTPIGSRHAIIVAYCPHKPAGDRLFGLPLPGAPAFVCATPCGRPCCEFAAGAVPPLPHPARLSMSLGLAVTSAALAGVTLGLREPVGTAADLDAPVSWIGTRMYQN